MFWNVRHVDVLHVTFRHLANQEVVESASTALAVEEDAVPYFIVAHVA